MLRSSPYLPFNINQDLLSIVSFTWASPSVGPNVWGVMNVLSDVGLTI